MRYRFVRRFSMIIAILLVVSMASCLRKAEPGSYQELVNSQLSAGGRHDRLILDLQFGMTAIDFALYCQRMNARKLFINGNGNRTVIYRCDTAFKSTVAWKFFPVFRQEQITGMRAELSYDAYAPWNRRYDADSLLKDIIGVFSIWYGADHFLVLNTKDGSKKLVKVDGNREISIYKLNDKDIRIDYSDLSRKEKDSADEPSL